MAIGLGSVLGGIVGAGSSIFNTIQSQKWNQTMLNAQRQENQLNRDFNANEAALQRQYGLDVMHEQQRYNSPQEFVKRLQAAGLNPALAYGQLGSDAATAPGGSAAASSGSISPTAYQGLDPLAASQAAKNFAEASNINQDTRNKAFEGTILETESTFREPFLRGQIALQNVQINLGNSQKNFTDAQTNQAYQQTKNLTQEFDNLKAMFDNIQKQTDLLDEQRQSVCLDNMFKSQTFDDSVRKFRAETKLAEDEAKVFLAMAFCEMANIKADTLSKTRLGELYNEQKYKVHTENGLILPLQAGSIKLQNQRLQFDLNQDYTWQDWERGVQIGTSVTNSVSGLVKAFRPF